MAVCTSPREICLAGAPASDAMREEVRLSPKPGLVDSLDNGAHQDMDLSLFLRSADALESYFREITEAAPCGDVSSVLPRLRPLGIRAEKLMFDATGGVNTHKGQIFSLGVCTAAAVRVDAAGEILSEAGRICRGLKAELIPARTESRVLTNGEKTFRETGTTGIRGEAEEGFPSVGLFALPAFRKVIREGGSRDEAALEALVTLMSVVTDSNVLHRRGWEGLALMRSEAENFLCSGGMGQKNARGKLKVMNEIFIRENISPGGCADLLALTLFISRMEGAFRG